MTEAPRVGGGRFLVKSKLGNGSFGDIFAGSDTWHGHRDVAIKLEHVKARHPQLLYEAKVYRVMHGGNKAPPGYPHIHWSGTEGDFNIMVIDLGGPCLEDLFCYCGRQFSLKTTLMVAEQMLRRIEHFHSCYFLHRDIKPENYLMGLEDKAHHLYIVDFGLAKRYYDPRLQQHIPLKEGKPLTGTARYCSANTHVGLEQSRRDDIESIGYVMIYFIRGSLPWQGIRADGGNDGKTARIGEKKLSIPVEYLCRDLPSAFYKYMKYARGLKFEEAPDYDRLHGWLDTLFNAEQLTKDWIFDWVNVRRREVDAAEWSTSSKDDASSSQTTTAGRSAVTFRTSGDP